MKCSEMLRAAIGSEPLLTTPVVSDIARHGACSSGGLTANLSALGKCITKDLSTPACPPTHRASELASGTAPSSGPRATTRHTMNFGNVIAGLTYSCMAARSRTWISVHAGRIKIEPLLQHLQQGQSMPRVQLHLGCSIPNTIGRCSSSKACYSNHAEELYALIGAPC